MNQARLLRETYRYGKNPECQACSKKLKFMNGTKGATSDHRYGEGKLITCLPSRWMKGFNVHKVVVIERDAFGILCGRCNLMLPADLKKRQERFGDDERFAHYISKPDARW